MDITARLNLLPDAVRRQILQAVCEKTPDRGIATKESDERDDEKTTKRCIAKNAADERHGSKQGASLRGPCPKPAPTAGTNACSGLQGSLVGISLAAGACVVDDFLTSTHVMDALECARQALAENHQQAAIGGGLALRSEGRQVDVKARGDTMRWLYPELEEAAGRGPLAALLGRLEALRLQLAKLGHDVGGCPTYQLACYPGGGARYIRHTDASISCPTRTFTAILYLNEADWNVKSDGGYLALYNTSYDGPLLGRGVDAGEPATLVAPLGGRLVVFESHLFHEVLPAYRHRYAVTVWFHRAAPRATPGTEIPALQPSPPDSSDTPQPPPQPPPQPLPDLPESSQLSQAQPQPQLHSHSQSQSQLPHTQGQPLPQSSTIAPGAADDSSDAVAASSSVMAGEAGGAGAPTFPSTPPPSRIFVSVAAYRDPECQWTLHSLLSRADRPERVRVGVVWQVDPIDDAAFVRVAGARAHPEWLQQVRQLVLPHVEATGPCKARALAQALWADEEYILQVDSHMRMVSGWDTLCIEQLAAAEARSTSGKAVLSTYPLGYSGEGAAASVPEEATAPATLLCAGGFREDGFLRTVGRTLRERPSAPVRSWFWAAGLSFARSSWLQEVPYCPYLPHLFFGEESYMLARMWTRGWDVFAPALPLAFHQWQRSARGHTYQRDHTATVKAADFMDVATTPNPDEPVADAKGSVGAGVLLPTASALPRFLAAPAPTVGMLAPRLGVDGAQDEASGLRKASQERVLAVLGRAVLCKPVGCVGGGSGVNTQSDVSARGHGSGGGVHGLLGASYGGGWGLGQVWGLGTVRTLEQMAASIGVDYAAGRVAPRAEWGGLQQDAFVL